MENIIFEKNIVFGKTEREYLTADIYRPRNSDDEYLPILVLIHGGGFQSGSKEMNVEWGVNLAKDGYFVMSINYTLSKANSPAYPKVFDDIQEAMNWLVLNSNKMKLDIERIGLIGDSAGAYLSSYFALKNNSFNYRICSVIGIYGIYDLVDECSNPINDRKDNIYERFLGMPFKGNLQTFHEASPTFYIQDAVDNPTFDVKFLLVWGDRDKVVKPSQSSNFVERLKNASIYVETQEIGEVGHYWFNKLPNIEGGGVNNYPNVIVYPKIIDFLGKTLRDVPSGNFSSKQIHALANLENLVLEN